MDFPSAHCAWVPLGVGARRRAESADRRFNKRSNYKKYDLLLNFPSAHCAWVPLGVGARRHAESADRRFNK